MIANQLIYVTQSMGMLYYHFLEPSDFYNAPVSTLTMMASHYTFIAAVT